jgi:hypothetical protein
MSGDNFEKDVSYNAGASPAHSGLFLCHYVTYWVKMYLLGGVAFKRFIYRNLLFLVPQCNDDNLQQLNAGDAGC